MIFSCLFTFCLHFNEKIQLFVYFQYNFQLFVYFQYIFQLFVYFQYNFQLLVYILDYKSAVCLYTRLQVSCLFTYLIYMSAACLPRCQLFVY